MSDYKKYLLRQLGIKESQLPRSVVEKNEFPGIDPDELEAGTKDEEGEHNMSPEKAKQTAIQHLKEPDQAHYYSGMEKAQEKGMLKDMLMGKVPSAAQQMVSPTAIRVPIIGVSVRGSSTGGLPSGIDQTQKNITPSNFGGYQKIPVDSPNSKLINKTPVNPQIGSDEPIANTTEPTPEDPHPHQSQNSSGEPPQAVTGASTDSDNSLTLKSAMPKEIDIDVSEEDDHKFEPVADENPESTSPNKEGMVNEGKHKAGCKCGFCANKGTFGKKKKENDDSDDKDESDKDDKNDYKVKKKFGKDEEEVNETFARHKKFLNNKLSESTEKVKCKKCGKMFTPNYGEYSRCPDCLASEHEAGEKATGVQENVKIPTEKLISINESLRAKFLTGNGLSEKESKLSRRVNAALNMRKANEGIATTALAAYGAGALARNVYDSGKRFLQTRKCKKCGKIKTDCKCKDNTQSDKK
jgi:hypothetical protein